MERYSPAHTLEHVEEVPPTEEAPVQYYSEIVVIEAEYTEEGNTARKICPATGHRCTVCPGDTCGRI